MKSVYFGRPLDNLIRHALSVTVATGTPLSGYDVVRLSNNNPSYPFKIAGTALDLDFVFTAPVLPEFVSILNSNLNVAAHLLGHSDGAHWGAPDVDVTFGVPVVSRAGFFASPWRLLVGLTPQTHWRLHITGNALAIIIGELWLGATAYSVSDSYLFDDVDPGTEGSTIVHTTDARLEMAYPLATPRETINGSLQVSDADLATLQAQVEALRFQARPFPFVPRDDVDNTWWVKFAADRLGRKPLAPDVTRVAFPVRQVGLDLPWIDPDA